MVDWKENPVTGQVFSAKIKNIPGFENKNKPLFKSRAKSIAPISSPKYSPEYLNLLKSAINDDGPSKSVKTEKKFPKNYEISEKTMGRWKNGGG